MKANPAPIAPFSEFDKEYRSNESINYHSENDKLLATRYGSDDDIASMIRVQQTIARLGYSPAHLMATRDEIRARLMPKFYAERKKN